MQSRTPLEVFLQQFSEGNLQMSKPQVESELGAISDLWGKISVNPSSERVKGILEQARTKVERSEIIEFLQVSIQFLRNEGMLSSEDTSVRKRLVFHLIQIAKLLGHQPSQSQLKQLAAHLVGE